MDAITIAFASGKGGTGKSVSSVYVGAALAAKRRKVVLLELAAGLRSVDIMAGVSEHAVFDMEDVLSGRAAPSRAVVESPLYPGLSIVPAPYFGGKITYDRLQQLCGRFRPHFDFILLDVATGYGEALEAALGVSQRLTLVATPDPVALRDARALVDTTAHLPSHLRLILNRVDARQIAADGVLEDLDEALDIVGVQLLGVVPESAAIQKAAARGIPLPAHGREAKVYAAIASRIAGMEVPLVIK